MNLILESRTVRDEIPVSVDNGSLLSIVTKDVTPYTHGFHKYPSKFIPQIPRWAIHKYLAPHSKKIVIDPFCGSGTTLVESLLSGHNAIGIDIDPLSVLISKVKTTPIDLELLHESRRWLVSQIYNLQSGSFTPDTQNIDHWFSKSAIKNLSRIRTAIDNIPDEFGDSKEILDTQEFYIICFSSILRRVSNADNQSQKTYVSHTLTKTPEEVLPLFMKRLDYFTERITGYSNAVNQQLNSSAICGSSVSPIKPIIQNKKADLAITSPPYIKAIDYIYNQMVELFWVGDLFDLQTQTLQNMRKREYVGTKQITKTDYIDFSPRDNSFSIPELDRKLEEVYSSDEKNGHKHAYITHRFFKEMATHFSQIVDVLKPGSHYIMVIGDSAVSGVGFDTSQYITELAEDKGFVLTNSWAYMIKNHYMRFNRKGRGGIIKTDWVLDFIRP